VDRFWAQPLRRQLFLSIALLLLPVLGAAAWSASTTLRERENDLRDAARIAAVTAAAYVEGDLASIDRTASGLALNPYIQNLRGEESVPTLRTVTNNRPSILDIVIVNRDGMTVGRAGGPNGLVRNYSPPMTEVLKSQGRVVLPMAVGSDGRSHYTSMGYPLHDDAGRTVGALWFLVSLDATQRSFAQLPLPPGSVVTIVDASNVVLMRSLDPERYVGKPLHGGNEFPAGQDWAIHESADGTRRMYVRQAIDRGPWVLSVGIPTRVALTKAISVWERSATILVIGLLAWLLFAAWLSKRVVTSVHYLDGAAQRIAAGDFATITPRPMPNREFQDLQDAFVEMLRRFNETKAELDRHLSEERRISQELQSLQRQVIRQERLAAVGQLVSGVAHEINNPLQSILGFSELLQMQTDVSEDVKSDLRLIQKESARACAIIRNLAMFARQQPGEASPVRLADVVNAVVELRQRRLETENITLVVENHATRLVSAVLTELQQVTLNFVVNAEQAIKLSGKLPGTITVRTYDAGEFVGLEVEDTGPGVSPENEAKLFQPFFTTKPVGVGTGLGLSVSYGIIDSMGGRIGHRPGRAGGATFYFELPALSNA
jgi:C4-dicarboxylate-specific signal transduction histidine kinase